VIEIISLARHRCKPVDTYVATRRASEILGGQIRRGHTKR